MSYASYARTGRGYAPYARPGGSHATGGGSPGGAAAPDPVPTRSFLELPVTGGVGHFHINHFIGYSGVEVLDPMRAARKAARLTKCLWDDFTVIFSETNLAKATPYPNSPALLETFVEFALGGTTGELLELAVGVFHKDWVVLSADPLYTSFYAKTLKRLWIQDNELDFLIPLAEKLELPVERLLEVNQHHFLAGRRSWKVGYDDSLRRFYVETAALERNSVCEYHVLEELGVMREAIVTVWTNLIDNFESHVGWVAHPKHPENVPPEYLTRGNAVYRSDACKTAAEALTTSWFAPVLARHPGLVKDLVF